VEVVAVLSWWYGEQVGRRGDAPVVGARTSSTMGRSGLRLLCRGRAPGGTHGCRVKARRWTLSVRNVVPTLTVLSAEICLSMVGAKQLKTLGLSWFRPGSYVQQGCARGTILLCTGVPVVGRLQARWERRCGLQVPRGVIEASANIVGKAESV
jgi:hypothetical protein